MKKNMFLKNFPMILFIIGIALVTHANINAQDAKTSTPQAEVKSNSVVSTDTKSSAKGHKGGPKGTHHKTDAPAK